jgi:hypothetical protein
VVASLKGVAQKASDASKGAVARVKQMSPKSFSTEEPAAVKETDPHDVKNVVTSTSEHSKMSKVTTATKKVCYFCVAKCGLSAAIAHIFTLARLFPSL